MTKRRFIFGEEWLYIKLYSGPKITEEILVNHIYPHLKHYFTSGIITKFFFVRYYDEGYHIRLRFRLADTKYLSPLLISLSEVLRPYTDNRFLSNVTIEIYNREMERYGQSSIEYMETIFSNNSWEILTILDTEKEYKERWLYGIKVMDTLLDRFGLKNQGKYELYQELYLLFQNEFQDKKSIKDSLKETYREQKKEIEKIIAHPFHSSPVPNCNLENTTAYAIKQLLQLRSDNEPGFHLKKLLLDIIHMHYNRVFRINHKSHELVIYYMMSCFYKSQYLKEKAL